MRRRLRRELARSGPTTATVTGSGRGTPGRARCRRCASPSSARAATSPTGRSSPDAGPCAPSCRSSPRATCAAGPSGGSRAGRGRAASTAWPSPASPHWPRSWTAGRRLPLAAARWRPLRLRLARRPHPALPRRWAHRQRRHRHRHRRQRLGPAPARGAGLRRDHQRGRRRLDRLPAGSGRPRPGGREAGRLGGSQGPQVCRGRGLPGCGMAEVPDTHTIRTQSTVTLIGGSAPARWWAAQRDDMANLQAALVHDDALDDEPQDGLLVGEARLCKGRIESPQKRRSKLPQSAGPVISRDQRWAAPFLGGRPRRFGAAAG